MEVLDFYSGTGDSDHHGVVSDNVVKSFEDQHFLFVASEYLEVAGWSDDNGTGGRQRVDRHKLETVVYYFGPGE